MKQLYGPEAGGRIRGSKYPEGQKYNAMNSLMKAPISFNYTILIHLSFN